MNLLTADLGQYIPPTAPEFVAGFGTVAGIVGGLIFLALIMAFPAGRRGTRLMGWGYCLAFVGYVAAGGALIGTSATIAVDMHAYKNEVRASASEYDASVRDWLADDYQIVMTAGEASDLVDGKAMVTSVGGQPTVIHIIKATGGGIALVDAGEQVIAQVR